jgi:hypothetical protein
MHSFFALVRFVTLFVSVLKLAAMITFSSQFTMPSVVVQKRAATDLDVKAEILSPAAKKAKLCSTHPHRILEHLVRNVLPERCKKEKVKDEFYKAQLDDPDATMEECKRRLQDCQNQPTA